MDAGVVASLGLNDPVLEREGIKKPSKGLVCEEKGPHSVGETDIVWGVCGYGRTLSRCPA